jgi:hypothetical protein
MSERRWREEAQEQASPGLAAPASPAALLQRTLGNQRVLQLRRLVQRQLRRGEAPEWVRREIGETPESVRAVERSLEADAAAESVPLGGGEPMAPGLRRWAEAATGGSFGGVRIVPGADASCSAMDALAFATPDESGGHEVHLSSQVDLGSQEGRFTLLHELAHVRQQQAGQTGDLAGLGGSEGTRDSLEAEADSVAQGACGHAAGGGR